MRNFQKSRLDNLATDWMKSAVLCEDRDLWTQLASAHGSDGHLETLLWASDTTTSGIHKARKGDPPKASDAF